MTFQQLAKKITLQEGKKISISIAQVSEVLKLLGNEIVNNPRCLICLLQCGYKLPKEMKKKKK